MALDDFGIVILPGVEVFSVAPGSKAPNRRKAAAIDPHWRIRGRISRPEKCGDHLVESCGRSRICLADIDAIGRVGELEIVHSAGAEDFAQLAHSDAARLAPRLLNVGSPGIGAPTAIAHR